MSQLAQTVAQVSTAFSAAQTTLLQRACSCGGSAGVSGKCAECEAEEKLGVQTKLTVNQPGDRYEQEADRIADAVIAGRPAGAISPLGSADVQRQSEHSDEEEELQLQRQEEDEDESLQMKPGRIQRQGADEEDEEESVQAKSAGNWSGSGVAQATAAATAVASGGRSLGRSERAYFEPRFGRDLSHVRLHTDAEAGRAASGIGARAYTLRNSIAFAPGQYAPDSTEGRRLLAHELTHTFQQGGDRTIRRTCPPEITEKDKGTSEQFESRATEALKHKAYRSLGGKGRRLTRHIIDGARGSACPMYYIEKLHGLLDTPDAPGAELTGDQRATMRAAYESEVVHQAGPEYRELAKTEEKKAEGRDWSTMEGNGATFNVDRSDLNDVVVQMKVRLKPKGAGTEQDVKHTRTLENAIEIAARGRGYTLDIEFVDRGGDDVFTVGVDPSKWPSSENWVAAGRKDPNEPDLTSSEERESAALALAHEAHHLLWLEDRYNLITRHAENPDIGMAARLDLFRRQMVRPLDPLADESLMKGAHATNPTMSDEDVCYAVIEENDDYEACLRARYAGLSLDEIADKARALKSPYRPENAALIEMLRQAWYSHPDRRAGCAPNDTACGIPPRDAFEDAVTTLGDAADHPLYDPHTPPAGKSLKRTRKSR